MTKLYRTNWDRRRWNATMNSPGLRRSFRRAARVRAMSAMHWQAYITSASHKGLIHKGGKP